MNINNSKVEYGPARRMGVILVNGGKYQLRLGIPEKLRQSYYSHILIWNMVFGGLFGFFIISPLAMVIEHATHFQAHSLMTDLLLLYLFQNIPWLVLFTLIGGSMGLFYGLLHMRYVTLREELYHKEKLATIGQLSAGVAHEINAPLANIALLAENIEMELKDEEIISKVRDIEDQVQAATTIISSLLDYSKRSKPEMMEVDMNDLILHTLEEIDGSKRDDIEVELRLSDGLPLVLGDHGQLKQVMLNIIRNTYDALPNGGKLEITSGIKGDKLVRLTFKDNGVGIPKDKLNKLYDPFFTTKADGVGLGLSISHGIINAHEGSIEVDSEVGKGTTFIIYLPRWKL